MKRSSSWRKVVTVVVLLAARALAQMGNPTGQDIQSPILADVRIDQKLNQQVPLDLTFQDESGRTVPLGTYFGKKPVILTLVYYQCPMLCTQVLNGMTSTLKTLTFDAGKDFEVVAVSIDPRETPQMAAEKKAVYLKEYNRPGDDQGWHFLVGNQQNISALADAVGFRYAWDARTQQYAHATAIMVLTPGGKLAQYFYGIEYSPRDVRFGLVQASQGRIGTLVDSVLLYCYHYDPTAGKYGLVVTRALQLGAGATLLILGGFLIIMFKADIKKPKLTKDDLNAVTTGRAR
jgi:protein SCO1/2